MKKTFLFLIFLLACAAAGLAQNYVDIFVADTIEVKAKKIVYSVMIDVGYDYDENYYDDTNYQEAQKHQKEKIRLKENELLLFFQSKKIAYEIELPNDYTITPYYQMGNRYLIYLKGEEELKKLHEQLLGLNYITGNIQSVEYDFAQVSEHTVFKRLYQKAQSKAASMATVMQRKLGQVILVEELTGNQSYDALSSATLNNNARYPAVPYPNYSQLKLSIEKSMRFRFLIE